MENYDPAQSNEWFDDTISHCTSDILTKSDEEILYLVYEEFDGDSWSFLHENTLNVLLAAGLINDEIYRLSAFLYLKAIEAFDPKFERSVEFIKGSPLWKEIFQLCDQIQKLKRGLHA